MWFHIQAAGRLMARRKGPVVRMMLVALVASAWCIAGAMWALGTLRDTDERASAMVIDVVCVADSVGVGARALAPLIARRRGVVEATVRSGEAVWKEFAGEFKIADDDLRNVAELPPMIAVRLRPEFVSQAHVERIVAELRQAHSRSIASITWSRSYVAMVEEYRRTLLVFGGAAGVLSVILFGVGIAYAFRAEIHRAGADLRVAELLGAPARWIAAPHTIVGLVAGAIGLLIGVVIVILLQESARPLAPWVARTTVQDVLLAAGCLAIAGAAISWVQSLLAVGEAIRRR